MSYIVKAQVAVVSIGGAGGNSVARFLRRGQPVPEGVIGLEDLVARGILVEQPEPDPKPEPGDKPAPAKK